MMSNPDLHNLSIADAARLIQSGQLSPVELTQALLSRIGQLDHRVQAFITLTADRALAAARSAEAEIHRGQYRGPLHGIPFGLKDIYNTAGLLTSGGQARLLPSAHAVRSAHKDAVAGQFMRPPPWNKSGNSDIQRGRMPMCAPMAARLFCTEPPIAERL